MIGSRHRRLAGALLCFILLSSVEGAAGQFRPRIVNGNHTQLFPTTGALLVNVGGQLPAICTGTLIGCNAFVTAAHCLCPGETTCTPSPTPYRVFLQHGGIYAVSNITVHPSYLFGEHNDVAILTLASPVSGISPTPINTVGSPVNGTAGTIAGFGVTRTTINDSGIKRAGNVLTSSCLGQVPQSHHICWQFEKPLGLPGDSSNTCSGDSGGPLFVDFGGGQLLAGITSGGFSETCLPSDLSFDTDIFVNSGFIDANADLSNLTCGTISQVGDAGTEVIVGGTAALTRTTQKCRKEIGKQVSNYVRSKLRSMQRCLDDVLAGKLVGPCPDAATADKIQRAAARVEVARIGDKCSPSIIAASQFGGGCSGAADANDLRACILAVGDGAVTAMLDRQYADANPSGALPAEQAKCQKQIGSAANRYAAGRLRALTSCRDSHDKGRVESCPDSRAQTKLAKLNVGVEPNIERMCNNALVSALDGAGGFGGSCAGATTTSALAACQIAEHDAQVDDLLALVNDVQTLNHAMFDVTPGTDRFRVTVNGVDDGINDVDLYVRFGAPPTTTTFDASSTYGGVFDAVEIVSPSAGTWHVLVDDVVASEPDFQLTMTTFQP
jgi:hypothetical protein